MNLLQAKQHLEKLHRQIISERTDSPENLANLLRVTTRTLRSYLEQMRALGAQVEYSRSRQTYYYTQPVALRFGFEPIEEIYHQNSNEEKLEKGGGAKRNFFYLLHPKAPTSVRR